MTSEYNDICSTLVIVSPHTIRCFIGPYFNGDSTLLILKEQQSSTIDFSDKLQLGAMFNIY